MAVFLFFKYNTGMSERTLARNTTYFTSALTVQKILSFIYFWFISSRLFPDQLGQYVFALSFASLFFDPSPQ